MLPRLRVSLDPASLDLSYRLSVEEVERGRMQEELLVDLGIPGGLPQNELQRAGGAGLLRNVGGLKVLQLSHDNKVTVLTPLHEVEGEVVDVLVGDVELLTNTLEGKKVK